MSSNSYSDQCPKCGGNNMTVNEENRPYLRIYSECLDCGFCSIPKEFQMDLEELNDLRADNELEPLKELPVINLD